MSYLLLEDGSKIIIEDDTGYLLMESDFITPHSISTISNETRYPIISAEDRIDTTGGD